MGVTFHLSTLLQRQHSARSGDFVNSIRFFSIKLHIVETEETFPVPECHRDLMMGSLKSRLELLVGIPVNFQRLQYLDEADLSDHSTFKENYIVSGSTITMRIWSQDAWGRLVRAAVKGNTTKLHGLGATKTSLFCTAHSDLLNPEERVAWLAHRSFVALFVTARRGLLNAMEFLLQNGADPRYRTPLGRTALHAAAAAGQLACIEVLLNYGAQVSDEDRAGINAMTMARIWGNKESERRLFQCQWRMRMANSRASPTQLTSFRLHCAASLRRRVITAPPPTVVTMSSARLCCRHYSAAAVSAAAALLAHPVRRGLFGPEPSGALLCQCAWWQAPPPGPTIPAPGFPEPRGTAATQARPREPCPRVPRAARERCDSGEARTALPRPSRAVREHCGSCEARRASPRVPVAASPGPPGALQLGGRLESPNAGFPDPPPKW
ncbi:PREDICTED: ankyrin repeat domain-containing protein 60 [Gekko japonicus]|uniref:Ankyrin repeat domain-containing protein 60 n=1 Tax=Gekko japonicus TaxID=146911 RepID=A0ABM1KYQ3_GEKJA|nr:PREDICTED: ankyrin repeat domain-containing protein 60 [Gekko japonicus]